jgi:orotate phosphoribosyltransferase
VGAPLKGKNVLIIDDVVTAGTAIREAIKLVAAEGGKVIGFVVALDRQETVLKLGENDTALSRISTLGQIQREFGVQSTSIVTLDDLITVLKINGVMRDMERLEDYRKHYQAGEETAKES